MPTATAADVQGVIDTDLSTGEIDNFLADAEFEAEQQISGYAGLTTDEKTQLEKYLSALRIREFYDRAIQQGDRESVSITYEGPSTDALRRAVRLRDPSDSLADGKDTNRYVGKTDV